MTEASVNLTLPDGIKLVSATIEDAAYAYNGTELKSTKMLWLTLEGAKVDHVGILLPSIIYRGNLLQAEPCESPGEHGHCLGPDFCEQCQAMLQSLFDDHVKDGRLL